MTTKKKSDEEILFPEQKIAGISVRPWSFGELFLIADPLERVLDKIVDSGMSDILVDENGEFQLDYFSIARLFTLASQELLDIISETLGIEKEKVEALSATDGIAIVLLMFQQNKEMLVNAIKNALSSPLKKKTKLQKKIKKKKEGEQKKTQ